VRAVRLLLRCVRCWLAQAKQFGSSFFLQAPDYQAAADIRDTAHSKYILNDTHLTFLLDSPAVTLLKTRSLRNQFRTLLSPGSFSNFDGEATGVLVPDARAEFK
jgi:hypothetical protein